MADGESSDEEYVAAFSKDDTGETAEDLSGSSVVTVSSDSWEKVDRPSSGEPGDQQFAIRRSQKASSPTDRGDSEGFSETEDRSVEDPPIGQYKQKNLPEAVFDGHEATVYHAHHDDARKKYQQAENKGTTVLSGRRTTDEKSSLVNDRKSIERDVILPRVPEPGAPFEKERPLHLPPGIGTGVENPIASNISSLEEGETGRHMSSDSVKGLSLAFLGAGVMYGVTSVLVRLAGENGFGSVQVLFLRSIFQSILMGAILLCKGIGLRPPPGRAVRCFLIAVTYCLATFASYEAFNLIRPGSAIASRGAARTIFSMILTYLITREKLRLGDIITLLSCIGGIAMIVSSALTSGQTDYILPPGMADNPTAIRIYGYSLILVGGLCRSLGMLAVRGAKDDLDALSVVFYHSTLAVVLTIFLLATVRQPSWPPSWAGVVFAIGVCLASAIATWSSNQAVKYVHPALVNLGINIDIVVSVAMEHAILQMPPRALEMCGAGLILVGVCGLTLGKYLESRKEKYLKLES